MNNRKAIIIAGILFVGILFLVNFKSESGHSKNEDCDACVIQDECGASGDCSDKACSLEKLSGLEKVMCEHKVGIIDCDNCRFEVGVVKIDPSIAESLIETSTVEDIERASVFKFTGQIQLDLTKTVEVVSAGSGRVEQVSKLLGDKVEKSDILAVIHSADLGQAKASFLEVQSKLELSEATFKREKELYEKKISSQADYLNALR